MERAVAVHARVVGPLLDLRDRVDLAHRIGVPAQPLVGPRQGERKSLVRRMPAVEDVHDGLLLLRRGGRRGVGPEQPQLGELDQRLTAVRGDVEPVVRVRRGVLELVFLALEPLGEGLPAALVEIRPGRPVLRALEGPVLRVPAGEVVGRRQRVVRHRDGLVQLALHPRGRRTGQPLGVVVPVEGLVLGLVRRVVPARRALRHLLRDGEGADGTGADQLGEPGRVHLRAGGVTDADEPAAAPDERLEGGELRRVQIHALGGQEHHAAEPGQVVGGEDRRILGLLDGEPVLLAQFPDRRRGRPYRVVLLRGLTAEDQHVDGGLLGGRGGVLGLG